MDGCNLMLFPGVQIMGVNEDICIHKSSISDHGSPSEL